MALLRTLFALSLASTVVSAAEPSRMIPSKGLEAYLEFDGLDAHVNAWNATAAHAILEKTPAGAMIVDLVGQVADRRLRKIPGVKLRGEDIEALIRQLSQLGFVAASHGHGGLSGSITVVLPGAGRKENRERFERLFRPLVESKHARKLRMRGRELFQVLGEPPLNPERTADLRLVWWFDSDALVILVSAPQAHLEAVLDAIDGKAANATTHPGRLAAIAEGKAIPGYEPDGLFFIEPGKNGQIRSTVRLALESAFADQDPAARRLRAEVEDAVRDAESFRDLNILHLDQRPVLPPYFVQPPPTSFFFNSTFPQFPVVPPSPPFRVVPLPLPLISPLPQPPIDLPELVLPPAPPELPLELREGLPTAVTNNPWTILGIDGITRIVGRHGFQGKALLSVVRVETLTPRKGMFASLDVRPFRKDSLPPFPRGATSFTVVGLDPGNTYDKAVMVLKTMAPEIGEMVGKVEANLKEATGLRSRQELLDLFGSTWSLVTVPNPKYDDYVDPVIVTGVRDPEALVKVLDPIATRINTMFRDREARAADANRGKAKDLPILALERLPVPEQGFRLTSPSRLSLFFGDGSMEPTILIGKKYVAFALHAKEARTVLSAETDPAQLWTPAGEVLSSLAVFPDNLVMLSHRDSVDSPWPAWLAHMPALVQLVTDGLENDDSASSLDFLGLLGLPEPGGFRVRIAPSKVPTEDQIKPHLFPGMMAVSVDDRGIRWIVREAFPTVLPAMVELTNMSTCEWMGKGFKRDVKFKIKMQQKN